MMGMMPTLLAVIVVAAAATAARDAVLSPGAQPVRYFNQTYVVMEAVPDPIMYCHCHWHPPRRPVALHNDPHQACGMQP